MQIEIRSRAAASTFTSDVPWAAISISSYRDEFPALSPVNRQATLQACFADVTKPEHIGRLDALVGKTGSEFFAIGHAKEILGFIPQLCNTEVLLVHCEQGYSRSPAVAAVVHQICIGPDDQDYFRQFAPNRHVYELLLEAARDLGHLPARGD